MISPKIIEREKRIGVEWRYFSTDFAKLLIFNFFIIECSIFLKLRFI